VSAWQTLSGEATRIIAHRGASGLRPEHTLEGYRLAIEQGADVIEPDLVPSRDGVLFARHERELSRSTDVVSRKDWRDPARRFVRTGAQWFAEDYDAERLAQLRAVQPFPARSRAFDGQFAIPRFSEILDLAARHWQAGRVLGVYPEIKHPSELQAKGFDSTAMLIDELRRYGVDRADSPVWVQCFELEPLRRVFEACGNPTFALFERLDVDAMRRLKSESPWLAGVALSKANIIGSAAVTDFVARAHELGLQVHVWTLRDDAVLREFDNVQAEYAALFASGVDAMFCDFPASGIAARQLLL
jgi:glycerophosphoryl diester phosphodiesterase